MFQNEKDHQSIFTLNMVYEAMLQEFFPQFYHK